MAASPQQSAGLSAGGLTKGFPLGNSVWSSVIDRQGGALTKANRRVDIARVELTKPFAARQDFLGVRALAAVRLEGVFDAWRASR